MLGPIVRTAGVPTSPSARPSVASQSRMVSSSPHDRFAAARKPSAQVPRRPPPPAQRLLPRPHVVAPGCSDQCCPFATLPRPAIAMIPPGCRRRRANSPLPDATDGPLTASGDRPHNLQARFRQQREAPGHLVLAAVQPRPAAPRIGNTHTSRRAALGQYVVGHVVSAPARTRSRPSRPRSNS